MKKLNIALAILASFTSTVAFAQVSGATTPTTNGNLTVNGLVHDQTCKLDTGSENIIVNLPVAMTTELNATAAVAQASDFKIKLVGCNKAQAANQDELEAIALFKPLEGNFNPATFNLVNKASDTPATNVEIQLLNKDGTVIAVGKGLYGTTAGNTTTFGDASSVKGEKTKTHEDGVLVLTYKAQYYATAQATPGKVMATTPFSITYR